MSYRSTFLNALTYSLSERFSKQYLETKIHFPTNTQITLTLRCLFLTFVQNPLIFLLELSRQSQITFSSVDGVNCVAQCYQSRRLQFHCKQRKVQTICATEKGPRSISFSAFWSSKYNKEVGTSITFSNFSLVYFSACFDALLSSYIKFNNVAFYALITNCVL